MGRFLNPEGLATYTSRLKTWVTGKISESEQIATIMKKGQGGLVTAPVIFTNPFGMKTKRILIRSVTYPMDTVEITFTEDQPTASFVGSRMELGGESLQTWLIYGEATIDDSSLTLNSKTGAITPEFEFPFVNESLTEPEIVFGTAYPFLNILDVPYVATFFK